MTTPAMVVITNNYSHYMPNTCYSSGLTAHCSFKKQTKKELNKELDYITCSMFKGLDIEV